MELAVQMFTGIITVERDDLKVARKEHCVLVSGI
jgi:hypothetical protein